MCPIPLKDITIAAVDALNTGQNGPALELASRAASHPQSGHLQRLVFAMAAERTMVPALASQIRKTIESVLDYEDIENQRLFPCWFYIFKTSPEFQPLWEKSLDWAAIEPVLSDKFIIGGLKKLNFLDWDVEQIFTRLRRDLLLEHFPKNKLQIRHLPILCALAEHCYLNGYVFGISDEELDAVEKISPDNPVHVALIGCYKPLIDITFNEKMSAVAGFRSMVKTHVTYMREEHDIDFSNPAAITGSVTKSVQAMYEEDPYPRWTTINMPYQKIEDVRGDILLAGCGTGQMALGFASAFPNCNFTAIDISRASLAYAARMAKAHNVNNIEFEQIDILQAYTLGKKFDYIECSGVLHHMEDPEAGWRSLTSCLAHGGGMQIALYSAKTRGSIDKVKAYIKEKGYRPVRADIRKLRADIAAMPAESELRDIMTMRDFYSVSMARDLVFHIQEAAYDLPTIAGMMDRLGLSFDGFKIHDGIKAAYRARFRDDPEMINLDNWHLFETENPETFTGMYKIFCHKKGETVTDLVKNIREIQA